MYFTHKEMKSMIEIEMKLMLARYNMLSKERAKAAYVLVKVRTAEMSG